MIDAEAVLAIFIFVIAFVAARRRVKIVTVAAVVLAVLSLVYAALSMLVGYTFADLGV